MSTTIDRFMREQLLDRRQKLDEISQHSCDSDRLLRLLAEVDSALAKIDSGRFGICETCHDSIECDRLISDPLVRFCLDHLTSHERSALEQDLELARSVQAACYRKEISTAKAGRSAITTSLQAW